MSVLFIEVPARVGELRTREVTLRGRNLLEPATKNDNNTWTRPRERRHGKRAQSVNLTTMTGTIMNVRGKKRQ